MANSAYRSGLEGLANFDWSSDPVDLGVILVENTYSYLETHGILSDVVAHEASGAGYARKAIAAAVRSTGNSANGGHLLIADGSVQYTALDAGTDLRVILFFNDQADLDDNSNPLLGYYDTGINIPIDTIGQNVTLNFNSLGAIRLRNVGSP